MCSKDPILNQINLVHILTPCFFNGHFNIFLPSKVSHALSSLWVFWVKVCIHFLFIPFICLFHPARFDYAKIFGGEYKLCSSLLRSLFRPPVILICLVWNILFSILWYTHTVATPCRTFTVTMWKKLLCHSKMFIQEDWMFCIMSNWLYDSMES
jgi:hypothetical protein